MTIRHWFTATALWYATCPMFDGLVCFGNCGHFGNCSHSIQSNHRINGNSSFNIGELAVGGFTVKQFGSTQLHRVQQVMQRAIVQRSIPSRSIEPGDRQSIQLSQRQNIAGLVGADGIRLLASRYLFAHRLDLSRSGYQLEEQIDGLIDGLKLLDGLNLLNGLKPSQRSGREKGFLEPVVL